MHSSSFTAISQLVHHPKGSSYRPVGATCKDDIKTTSKRRKTNEPISTLQNKDGNINGDSDPGNLIIVETPITPDQVWILISQMKRSTINSGT